MRCEAARRQLSAEADGATLSPRAQRHIDSCKACQRYRTALQSLSVQVDGLAQEPAPDVVDRVLQSLPRGTPAPRTRWLSPAFGIAAGLIVGIVLAGGFTGPGISVAVRLPAEIVERQTRLSQLTAKFDIVEVISPDQRRAYRGEIHFESPEYLAVQIAQTSAPNGWSRNDWSLLIDGTTLLIREPFPCPQLGGCPESPQRSVRVTGRDPYSDVNPAPLDIVIPTSVLKGAQPPAPLPERNVAGRRAVGFEVTAAQARPLLDGYLRYGSWREVHDTDLVSIWVDSEYLTPLLVEIIAASDADRRVWAARRGYQDGPEPYLTIEYLEVSFEIAPRPDISVPADVTSSDGGFRPADFEPPIDPGMPLVSAGRIEGFVDTEVWAWSDGRAFIRLARTEAWPGPGLFGSRGLPVETVETEKGVVYLAGDESAAFVRGDGYDATVTGSVAVETLLDAASSLPGPHRAVPELSVTPEQPIYLPTEVAGFAEPIIHAGQHVVTIDLFGGGESWVRITQREGERISPPLDPDARAIELRGRIGRYSPAFGTIEWVEDGIVFVAEAPGLTPDQAVAIAESMTASSAE